MTRPNTSLRKRARASLAALNRRRSDPRFRRTLGKLVAAGLLETNLEGVTPFDGRVTLADALFAGDLEPRVLELLPSIVVKQPDLLVLPKRLPEDLGTVLDAIRKGLEPPAFRGVPARAYLPWIERIGRRGQPAKTLRTFRLAAEDLARLRALKDSLPAKSETDVIRRALRLLEHWSQAGRSPDIPATTEGLRQPAIAGRMPRVRQGRAGARQKRAP